jgi:serine/threonine protein kinase
MGKDAQLQAKKIFMELGGKILNPSNSILCQTCIDFTQCKYNYQNEINQGGSSEVGTYCLNNKIVALKVQQYHNAIREISHLKYIGPHPFICEIIKFEIGVQDIYGMIGNDVGIVDQDEVIYIFMPLYKSLHKEIYGIIDRDEMKESPYQNLISETRKKKYMRQILVVIGYLHSKNIIHMDIKPENILLDDNDNIKLIDFDCSVYDASKKLRKTAGTFNYLPPEFLTKEYVEFSTEVDIYTAGLTFIEIITGIHSRKTDNCGIYKNLIDWMLSDYPSSRPNIRDCIDVLDSL